ncbi:MAG: hypothetical protein J6Q71_01165 [Bacteroidales bacterium]|nr:hypothetical protein [Bacteroidales bacterium]
MSINSNNPKIAVLRERVESRFGKALSVHNDFVSLVAEIEFTQRQHISESTLERVWNYSTRGYDTVSLRTLDVLSNYAASCDWKHFCMNLTEELDCDSDMFTTEFVYASDLQIGDSLCITWLPDRRCELRYLGDNRFVVEGCEHTKLSVGDTFTCSQFVVGKPLILGDLTDAFGESRSKNYIIGQRHGLITLKRL